jgi:flagellar basal-body rod protein FlgB
MANLTIFAVGHERSRWLAARAAATAMNVASADTPGYRARDVAPFDAVMKTASVDMARTQAAHIDAPAATRRTIEIAPRSGDTDKHSGNSVSLETEMAKIGEIRGQQSLVIGVLGAFHRMLISSVKG